MAPQQEYPAQTARLYLEPLSVEHHLEAYHALYSDPACLAYSTQGVLSTIAETRIAMLGRLRSDEKPWVESYAILLRPEPAALDKVRSPEDGPARKDADGGGDGNASRGDPPRFIGLVGSVRQSPPPESYPELGYRLHPDYFGKGYATEAVGAFVKLYWTLPDRMNVQKIAAVVDVRNVASGRVMEKLGARRTDKFMLELDKLGNCEMERWALDRPKEQ